MHADKKEPKLIHVFLVFLVLVFIFFLGISQAKVSGHVPLILGAVVAISISMFFLGHRFEELEKGAIKTLTAMLPAVFSLFAVGMMVAMWIACGLIPLIMYYGVDWLNPRYFLVSTFLLCSLISSFTGSSWTTGATIGLALLGISQAMGLSTPLVVGAIISGSYVGDKISPLSDNTNLSAGMTEVALFRHVHHSLYTTIPAFVATTFIFLAIGVWSDTLNLDTFLVKEELKIAIQEKFNLSFFTLSAPVVLFTLVYFRVPAFLALVASALYAAVLAFFYEGLNINQFFSYLTYGYVIDSSSPIIGELFNRGGLFSMLNTVGLILCASLFGGIMESSGMIHTLSKAILRLLTKQSSLYWGVGISAIMFNILLADEYLAIIMSANMFKEVFKLYKVHSLNLARIIGDTAVTTSVFFPWNTCGAYFIGVLNIPAWTYIPFCFFNLISVVLSLLYGHFNWFVKPIEQEEMESFLDKYLIGRKR